MRLRLLLVINGLDFGGTESAVAALATELARRGHDVRVLTLKRPGRTAARLCANGITVETLGMEDVVDAHGMAVAAWRLAWRLRGTDADVVHAFLPRANIVSRVAARMSVPGRPHVSSERSTDFRRSALVRRLNRLTARWTDLVLAVSPMVRDVLIARDRIPATQIAVLENGVDLAAVDAVPRTDVRRALGGVTPERTVVCGVGRLVPEKGFTHLLHAVARMRRPDALCLVLVGEGPEEATLRATAAAIGVPADVRFAGYRPDVLAVLKGCDAYVLSSVEEGSPMVLLEAMACRLPAVATDVSGVSALAGPPGPDRAALVVPPPVDWSTGDGTARSAAASAHGLDALADALDRLVGDPALRDRLGRAARRRIEEHFTLARITDRLEQHYLRLLEARGRVTPAARVRRSRPARS